MKRHPVPVKHFDVEVRLGRFLSLTEQDFMAWLQWLQRAGYTGAAIGRMMGVSRQAVNYWIHGRAHPSGTALRLAERLMRGDR